VGMKVVQQRLLVLKHRNFSAGAIIDKGVEDVPKDAEDQVAVDNEEGLQAFGVVVLVVVGKEGGREGWGELHSRVYAFISTLQQPPMSSHSFPFQSTNNYTYLHNGDDPWLGRGKRRIEVTVPLPIAVPHRRDIARA